MINPYIFLFLWRRLIMAEVAQIQPTQDEPNPSTTILSQPLADSEPSASGSQKSEVTKKKRKNKEPMVTINECIDETVLSEETESTLASLLPRKKKQKTKTGSLSSLSQQGDEIIQGANLLLEAFSQQNVSIEKSILPNAPCKESAPLQGHSLEGERRQLEAHTMSGEHISFETPYLLRGSCQKSILQPLLFQNLQILIFLWQLRTILLVLRTLNIKIFSLMCQLQVTQCMTLCSPPRTYIRMLRDCMLGQILMTTPQT